VPPYTLRVDIFEGPLDLLLSLIEKRKLLINDISLAEVADDYINYLEQHKEFPLAETAQFVLVGSALLLLKSRSLLPVLSLTEEENGSIEDLSERLRTLERYRELGQEILVRYDSSPLFSGKRNHAKKPVFSPDTSMTVGDLTEAMRSVLAHLPKAVPELAQATVRKILSLEEVMARLTARINASMEVSFREFASLEKKDKVSVIVSFLAMLELVRAGVVRVEQATHNGDITITSDKVGVPHYG